MLPARIEHRAAALLLALLPGLLVLYFGFNGGGFFPGTAGFACMIVIQLLMIRVLMADHPFEGFNRRVALVGAPLAAFVTWVLLSATWSDADDRALIEFDRGLLYLLLFVLFALVARTGSRVRWMVRGIAVAIFVCSFVGLYSRLEPDVLHRPNDVAISRLAYPLTYWNALGILASIGILLCLGLAASRTEPRPVRALAAGAVPILAVTAFFTFSRGAFLALAIALVVFLVAARSRGLPGTLLATVPATTFAVMAAYGKDELSSSHPDTALGASQGGHLLKVVLAWALVAAAVRALAIVFVDRPLGRVEATPARRRAAWLATGGALLCALLAALALGAPDWISRQYDGFVHGQPTNDTTGDLRLRLTDPSSNGRIDHWRVAVRQFGDHAVRGSGAGTYEFAWHQRRREDNAVVDAHSLYLEVMAEFGLVGLLLLAAAIVGIVIGIAARVRGENRVLYAGLLAAVVAWAVHAGMDWDWEMPAVTAWVFAAGGAAAAGAAGARPIAPGVAQRSRIPVAAALLVAAATPVLLLFSQSRLQAAADAFDRRDCDRARAEAFDSIDAFSLRPEPYRLIGFCSMEEGRATAAVNAMTKALDRSPGNWQSHYGLALALASAGRDPRAEIRRAIDLNPNEDFLRDADRAFRASPSPAAWRRAVPGQVDAAIRSGHLTFD